MIDDYLYVYNFVHKKICSFFHPLCKTKCIATILALSYFVHEIQKKSEFKLVRPNSPPKISEPRIPDT